jgi:restriction endonuclease Mrr
MVVTTGRFTGPATEYVGDLEHNDDPHPIELIDGEDLREIADEVGLDLYNGRIEILCEETLRPYEPATSLAAPVEAAVSDIENLDVADLPESHASVTFQPVVEVTAETNAVFETSVGVIHRIDDRTTVVIHANRGEPTVAESGVADLVSENRHATIALDADEIEEHFQTVTEQRFGQTETEYKDWVVEKLQTAKTTTVTYTGDNNVTYNKTCEPNRSDISVQSIKPVYLPEVRQTTDLGEYTYPYEYFAAGPSRVTIEDGFHRCVHCETAGRDESYTYCVNCGAIACGDHIKTERLEGEPVCTGCAVTEQFAFKTKYFYNEENLETFREEYAAMGPHQKAMENPLLAGGVLLLGIVVITGILVVIGGGI